MGESHFVDYVNCEMERKKFPSAWYGKVKLNFIGWTLDGGKTLQVGERRHSWLRELNRVDKCIAEVRE